MAQVDETQIAGKGETVPVLRLKSMTAAADKT